MDNFVRSHSKVHNTICILQTVGLFLKATMPNLIEQGQDRQTEFKLLVKVSCGGNVPFMSFT